jgi:uncharacterized membrane protein YkoI
MHRRSFILGVILLLLASGVSQGDDDHELARRLLQEGRIQSLTVLVESVRREIPGDLLEVEFELENGIYVYEFKILRPDGRIQEVEVDAATGKIVKVEDKD